MSIASSNQKPTHMQFTDLLKHYPRLAAWLVEMVQNRTEWQAEEILPAFLLECASQGLPSNAYPFTDQDRCLADLRLFLHDVQRELNTLAERIPRSQMGMPSGPASSGTPVDLPTAPGAIDEGQELGEIDDTPVVRKKSDPNQALVARQADAGELSEVDDTPVVRRANRTTRAPHGQRAQPPDPSRGVAEHIPVPKTPLSPEQEHTSAEAAETEVDVVQQETEPVAREPAPAVEAVEQDECDKLVVEAEQPCTVPPVVPRPRVRGKMARLRHPRTRRERLVSLLLLLLILGAILVPVGSLVGFGISAYTTYHALDNRAHSAVNHLLAVKTIFHGSTSHLTSFLDVAKLQQAEREFVASDQDFQLLQSQLQHSATLSTAVTYFPQYQVKVQSAQVASVIGMDVAKIGQIITAHAAQLAPSFTEPLLSVSTQPLLTQPMLTTIGATLDQVLPLLKDIQAHAPELSLATLPIAASQQAQIGTLLQFLPQAVSDLGQVRNLLGTAGWLLGVGQPRTFLVQTMDRAELRATGGFTGQYGELKINGGRVEPFNLKDISLIEYADNSNTYGQLAPQQYRSWWPFANWGMRDSNVSADFPTSAQMALQLYQQEVGTQADGVISFTPVVIEHILEVIGSVTVPGYNVTVTPQNLEDLLHYYQLDNGGILKQIYQQPDDKETSTRKRFTSTLASLLMNKVRSAPPNELLAIASQVFSDLKTKDLQIYFTDPGAEGLLQHYGYAGQMDRSTTHDGFYVVQENLSVSKASQYVQTTMHDTVTLNSQGGATHTLQIRLVYNQDGPVYGYDTYYDYLRVYVPPSSQLLGGDGFSTDEPLCGGSYGNCPANGPYPHGELTCPAGQYQPGAEPPYLTGSDGATWEPLHTLAGPSNTSSDEPGRAMYGGWVVVPKNCTMNVTLSWYVPPMSQQPYTLLVQRQAGTFPELNLSILSSVANCTSFHFDDILVTDRSFTPASTSSTNQGCGAHQGT